MPIDAWVKFPSIFPRCHNKTHQFFIRFCRFRGPHDRLRQTMTDEGVREEKVFLTSSYNSNILIGSFEIRSRTLRLFPKFLTNYLTRIFNTIYFGAIVQNALLFHSFFSFVLYWIPLLAYHVVLLWFFNVCGFANLQPPTKVKLEGIFRGSWRKQTAEMCFLHVYTVFNKLLTEPRDSICQRDFEWSFEKWLSEYYGVIYDAAGAKTFYKDEMNWFLFQNLK